MKSADNLFDKHRDMGTISVAEAEATVEEIQQHHWFVRWDGVDLLNMIEKKELSNVYP